MAGDALISNVFDVAKYVLKKAETVKCAERMTTLKLQKLVYYSQAWSLVWESEPLFREKIEAWANGPVVPELFNSHKGQLYICARDINGDIGYLTSSQKETIDSVMEFYGDKTSQYLSELTHMEDPWRDARKGIPMGEPSHNEITLISMKSYYESMF
jgi:uncharacterized phage-associated protein